MKIRTAILTMLLWAGTVAGVAAQGVEGKAVEVDGTVVATVEQGRIDMRCRGCSLHAENIPAGSFCTCPTAKNLSYNGEDRTTKGLPLRARSVTRRPATIILVRVSTMWIWDLCPWTR